MTRFLGTLFLLTVSASTATAQSGAGDYARSLVFEGRTRTYNVHVPSTYVPGSSVPLVLDFHGYTGTSSAQAGTSGFRAVSDAENFIVAYPQGVGNSWNAATFCCGDARAAGLDDVGLAVAIVDAINGDDRFVDGVVARPFRPAIHYEMAIVTPARPGPASIARLFVDAVRAAIEPFRVD